MARIDLCRSLRVLVGTACAFTLTVGCASAPEPDPQALAQYVRSTYQERSGQWPEDAQRVLYVCTFGVQEPKYFLGFVPYREVLEGGPDSIEGTVCIVWGWSERARGDVATLFELLVLSDGEVRTSVSVLKWYAKAKRWERRSGIGFVQRPGESKAHDTLTVE